MSKKITEREAKELDIEVEELELHDMNDKEIERVVSAMSTEGMSLRRARKKVRYQLYRLKAEAEGRTFNVSEDGFKEKFEVQPMFDGWKNFSINWDVALDDPYEIVSRIHSVEEEWNEVMKAKFPQVSIGGGITYPDIKVKKKVEAEAKLQNKAKKKSKGKK